MLKVLFLLMGLISGFLQAVIAQESQELELLDHLNEYPFNGYNDCWGYIGPDGREYALLGVNSGTSIVDITTAGSAVEVAFVPSNFSIWKDLKTYQNYAYTVNETGGGLQIIDLSGLPDSVKTLPSYTGFDDMHNINIDVESGMLYASADRNGFACQAISLADPENPQFISAFADRNHDNYPRGGIVYLAESRLGSVGIYDLSNIFEPQFLQRYTIPSAGIVHNLWLTDDGNFLMTTEETASKTVKMWDISDLNNITLRGQYLAPNGLAHNVHIKGDFAYISHYTDGIRVVDISDRDNLIEVGYYDTFPGSGFDDGNWGVYPYFPSGKLVVSDTHSGLYIVFSEDAVEVPTGINTNEILPETFSVAQNYPNPFNPTTTIEYTLSAAANVAVEIFNAAGQMVRTLENGKRPAGRHEVIWDSQNDSGNLVSSGTYFYRVEAGGISKMLKMTLIR